MSLWTPSGEHPVDRERRQSGTPASAPPGGQEAPSLEDLSPEERAQVEEMTRQVEAAQKRMLELPGGSVVGQHALQFYELAALYLSQDPPRVDDARLAIDALAAVLERLGNRLGDAEKPLRQAVTQLQLAFVEVAKQAPGFGETPGTGGESSG